MIKKNFEIFLEVFQIIIRNKNLLFEMTKRELTDRYAGQIFGLFWAVIHPIFLMGLFIFIFGVVFKQKI